MKKYTTPVIEITKFHTEDIITSSGNNTDDELSHSFNTLTGKPSDVSFPDVWPNSDM